MEVSSSLLWLFNVCLFLVPLPPRIINISYECKNDIRVAWIPQSQLISFYRIFLDAVAPGSIRQSMNTTKNEVNSQPAG